MNNQSRQAKNKMTKEDMEVLMFMLESNDGVIREKARESLGIIGKPAVLPLTNVLRNSGMTQVRWEAVKILGTFKDKRSLPSLVKALEDNDQDVAWVAAEALKNFRKLAWPALLRMLIKRGSDSVLLRNGVHHVMINQNEEGFNDLLAILIEALDSKTVPESSTIAANEILKRMKTELKIGGTNE